MTDLQHAECIAAIGSMTMAIKAQRALLNQGLAARVVALSPGETKHGCAYGVGFSCALESGVRATLQGAHIAASQFMKRG